MCVLSSSKIKWQEYCKSRKPSDIPSLPNRVYKDTGWINLGDWLGTGNVAQQNRRYRPFEECKAHVHKLSLKNREDWLKYTRSGSKPDDILLILPPF